MIDTIEFESTSKNYAIKSVDGDYLLHIILSMELVIS